MARSTPSCPVCGSTDTAKLVWGRLDDDEDETEVNGGCCCWGDERDPQWECRSCAAQWGAVVALARSSVPPAQSAGREMTIAEMGQMWKDLLGWS